MSRSQAERRHETQQKLLDATVACIVNHGFSRLTTLEIARTAGVSQGALFRYYPTKTAAVVAAMQRLFGKVMADFDCWLDGPVACDLGRLVGHLESWFASADFLAISRLFAESSADAELRAAIQPIVEQHRQHTLGLIEGLFPGEQQALQRSAAHAVIYLLQGIASERHLIADDHAERRILQLLHDLVTWVQAAQSCNGGAGAGKKDCEKQVRETTSR